MEDRHKTVRHKTVGGASGACVVIASVAKQSGVNCLNHDFHDLRIDRYHPLPPPKEGNFAIANHAHHLNHIKITVQTITHRTSPCPLQRRGIAQILFILALSIFTASAQDVAWKKNFGGSDTDMYRAVTAVSDGVVAAGISAEDSFGSGDWAGVPTKGSNDAIIVKYNNSGEVLWRKNFGGNGTDQYYAVTALSDGFVAVGYSYPNSFDSGDWTGVTGNGAQDAIIVKYDNDGEVVWKKNFGGSNTDYYYAVTAVADGIVAVGISAENSFGNGDWTGFTGNGAQDAIMVKYDDTGNVLWRKNFGGSGGDYYVAVTAVADGVVAAGYADPYSFGNGDWTGVTGNGSGEAIIVKYDNDGEIQWKKNFGGSSWDYYNGITAVADGVVAAGSSQDFGNGDWTGVTGNGGTDAIIVKYNNVGDVVWKKNFGGSSDEMYNAVTTVSDGVVAAGYSPSPSFGNGDWTGVMPKGSNDAIIVKYNNVGNVVWKQNFGGSSDDLYGAVTAVANGVVAVGDSYIGSFGNGDWTDVTGNGWIDAIIVKYFDTPPSVAVATQADFSCPGEVVVTYDLVSDLPVDVTLYYSPNQCDWLEAISVTGDLFAQTTGTGKTITWFNYNDNVRYGKFFFKVEAPEQCVPDCVMINGVCWAKYNLDVGGGFVANPEDYGALYQWGRKSDGHEDPASPIIAGPASGSNLDGDGQPAGSYTGKFITGFGDWRAPSDDALWNAGTENAPVKTVNDPCPCGWRVPTQEELQSLVNSGSAWGDLDGISGRFFGSGGNTIFLPAAGFRNYNSGSLTEIGIAGRYRSSTPNGTTAYSLLFTSSVSFVGNLNRTEGGSIRCVAE